MVEEEIRAVDDEYVRIYHCLTWMEDDPSMEVGSVKIEFVIVRLYLRLDLCNTVVSILFS